MAEYHDFDFLVFILARLSTSMQPDSCLGPSLTPNLTILDRQLRRLRRQQRLLVPRQLLLDLTVAVVLDNLAAVAYKQLRIHQAVKAIPDGL